MTLLVASSVLIAGAVALFGLFFGVGMLLGKRIDRAVMARFDAEATPDTPDTDDAPQEEAPAVQADTAETEGRKENDGRE